MIEKADLMKNIKNYLEKIVNRIEYENDNDSVEINLQCENVFCDILNIVKDLNMINLNNDNNNFPAIDIGDCEKRVCYQITSTKERQKINKTLEKFREYELNEYFDEINILILGKKKNLSIADRMSQLCGVLSHCLRTIEPVNAEERAIGFQC